MVFYKFQTALSHVVTIPQQFCEAIRWWHFHFIGENTSADYFMERPQEEAVGVLMRPV